LNLLRVAFAFSNSVVVAGQSDRYRGILALQFDPNRAAQGGLMSGTSGQVSQPLRNRLLAGSIHSTDHFYLAIPQSVDASDHPEFPLLDRSAQDRRCRT
jgi:hypothetical protein